MSYSNSLAHAIYFDDWINTCSFLGSNTDRHYIRELNYKYKYKSYLLLSSFGTKHIGNEESLEVLKRGRANAELKQETWLICFETHNWYLKLTALFCISVLLPIFILKKNISFESSQRYWEISVKHRNFHQHTRYNKQYMLTTLSCLIFISLRYLDILCLLHL